MPDTPRSSILRQQVVQAVAELVEQGDHLVVGELRRLAAHRPGEVAVQIGHRGLYAARSLRRRVMASSIQAPPRLVSRA
jgi:hypothetical protein